MRYANGSSPPTAAPWFPGILWIKRKGKKWPKRQLVTFEEAVDLGPGNLAGAIWTGREEASSSLGQWLYGSGLRFPGEGGKASKFREGSLAQGGGSDSREMKFFVPGYKLLLP